MFAREWEDFSNKLEKATSGREKLDKRVGKITTKFDAIKENDTASLIEEKDISDLSDESD